MGKKKILKTVIGIGAAVAAGKVVYDKYKSVKEKFAAEENESVDSEVKKYNAICENKVVEVEDEEFTGCDVKTIASKTVIDLGLATFERDEYIDFDSKCSVLTFIVPEGVNVTTDVENIASGVRNLVENTDEEGIHTLYVIGKAICSNVEIIPVNFYVDDEDDYEDVADKVEPEEAETESESGDILMGDEGEL